MKKVVSFLIVLFLSIIIFSTAYAEENTVIEGTYNLFDYTLIDGQITITRCNDYESETITIPSSINGYPVTVVGGFSGNVRKVKNVIIPEGVIEISKIAFYYCDTLEKISLPSTLISIGKSAFYNCDSLMELHIPKNLSSIGEEGSFRNCFSLPTITVDENNKYFSALDGVLYNKDKTKLILYPSGKRDEKYTISDNVKTISNYAFYNCDFLKELVFSDSVETIGESAVFYCDNITSIYIPKSVKSIGQVPFGVCDSLREMTISADNRYYSIENGILFNYDKTEVIFCIPNMTGTITLPGSVIEISDGAFKYSDVNEIFISKGTEKIGEMAFYNSSLETIHIPSSVLKIDEKAFGDCYSLSKIYYDGNKEQWDSLMIDKGNIMELTVYWDNEYANINIKTPNIYCYPNNTEILLKYTIVFCQYNKNKQLISCDIDTTNSNKMFKISSKAENAKVLIWENLTNMNPLLQPYTIYNIQD